MFANAPSCAHCVRHAADPGSAGHMKLWFASSTEEFPPSQMLEQCRAAEEAGFDGLGCSDHFAPWFPDGQASQAWVFLGALGQVTSLPMATGVTPVAHHYHPAVIAQAFASLAELYPGRVGSASGPGRRSTKCRSAWTGRIPTRCCGASSRAWRRSR